MREPSRLQLLHQIMKKHLLILFVLCLSSVSLYAQELAGNQRIVGNYTSNSFVTGNDGMGLYTFPGEMKAATWIPKDVFKAFHGAKIVGIRFALANACTVKGITLSTITDDVVASQITEVATDALTGTAHQGWNTVMLANPVVIDTAVHKAFVAGYAYTQESDKSNLAAFPLSLVNEGAVQATLIYFNYNGQYIWQDLGEQSKQLGNLSVQLIVETEGSNDMDLNLTEFKTDSAFYKSGGKVAYSLVVRNAGTADATYNIVVSMDGKPLYQHSSASALRAGNSTMVQNEFDLPADTKIGSHRLTAYVDAINGEKPRYFTSDDTVRTSFGCYSSSVPRQMNLVENYTSSSSSLCYLGDNLIDAMLQERSNIARVSIHGDNSEPDALTTAAGDSLYTFMEVGGRPAAAFNRTVVDDLSKLGACIGADYVYNISLNGSAQSNAQYFCKWLDGTASTPSFVTLTATAKATDEKLFITVDGAGVQGAGSLLENQRLYVYVTEDSIYQRQLSGQQWQTSYLNNAVLRAAAGSVYGNPIPWQGDAFTASFTLPMEEWNKDHLKVVAFIAPKAVVGADSHAVGLHQCTVAAVSPVAAVSSVAASALGKDEYFNLNGVRLDKPTKGVVIIRHPDGSICKQIFK